MNEHTSSKETKIKSLTISILFHAAILLIFFLVSFKEPQPAPPVMPPVGGIEVNLGNSDIGFGDIQPLSPGEPSPDISQETPAQSEESSSEETVSETSENDDPETQVINKQENKNQDKNNTSTTQTSTDKKPKTTFGGVTGTGGNNSDDFNDSRNQGRAGGIGDQGNQNGAPDIDNYNGSGGNGNGGPFVIKGGRTIVKSSSFKGDLPKATIYAEISVDGNGRGTFVNFSVDPKSTNFDSRYANAIRNYLPGIEFDKTGKTSTVTVEFVFDVKN